VQSSSAQRSSISHPKVACGKAKRSAGHGRQGVDDVAHGAEAHDEQAVESHDWRGSRRERMISVAGVVLGIAYDDDAASAGFDLGALGDGVRRCSRCLGVKVGWISRMMARTSGSGKTKTASDIFSDARISARSAAASQDGLHL